MVSAKQLDAIVARLRGQGTDDGTVEAKSCGHGLSKDIWETVSSFANTAGGLIICGIDEEVEFAPVAQFDLDRVRDQFVEGVGDGGSASVVAHPPHYELSRGMVDGSQVLLIEVEELGIQEKPCYIVARGVQGGSYKRVDDKDIRLSPSELYEMQSVLVPSDADGGLVAEATVDDLDDDLVAAVIDGRRRQSPRVLKGADTREQQLIGLEVGQAHGGVGDVEVHAVLIDTRHVLAPGDHKGRVPRPLERERRDMGEDLARGDAQIIDHTKPIPVHIENGQLEHLGKIVHSAPSPCGTQAPRNSDHRTPARVR